MKKCFFIIIMIIIFWNNLYAQNLGEIKKGTGERITFNRLSLVIPINWNYSKNPRETPGTDQLQLFSDDRNRTVMITVTKARPDVDFIEAEHSDRLAMLKRVMSIPGFENCSVVGKTPEEMMWGRKGILSEFDLFKNDSHKTTEVMLRLYNYGEQLNSLNEVLFISAIIIGNEEPDYNKLIKSLQLLEEK
jgi:hypothetical protein